MDELESTPPQKLAREFSRSRSRNKGKKSKKTQTRLNEKDLNSWGNGEKNLLDKMFEN